MSLMQLNLPLNRLSFSIVAVPNSIEYVKIDRLIYLFYHRHFHPLHYYTVVRRPLATVNVSKNNDTITYNELPDLHKFKTNSSDHLQKVAALKFPQDILAYAAHPDQSLSCEELTFLLKCLCATAKRFYAKRIPNKEDEKTNTSSPISWDPTSRIWHIGTNKILRDRRFGALITTITKRIDRFKPDDIIDCIHSLNVLQFKDKQLMSIVEGFVVKELHNLPAHTLLKVFTVINELGIAKTSCLTTPTIQFLMQMKASLDLSSLARLAYGACKASMYHVKVLEGISPIVEQHISQLTVNQTSFFIYSYAKLPKLHNGKLLNGLLQHALGLINKTEWEHKDIIRILQGAAQSGTPPVRFFQFFEDKLAKCFPNLSERDFTTLIWCYEKSQCGSYEFWLSSLQNIIDQKSLFFSRSLSRCLVSVSKCNIELGPQMRLLFTDCQEFFVTHLNQLQPKDVAQLLVAYGSLNIGSNQFYDHIGTSASKYYDEWTPEDLASVLYTLAKFRRAQPLFSVVHAETVCRLLQFGAKQLSKICWSFSVMGIFDRSLWDAIITTVEERKKVLEGNMDIDLLYPALLRLKRVSINEKIINKSNYTDANNNNSSYRLTLETPLIQHERVDQLLELSKEAFLNLQFQYYDRQDVNSILRIQSKIKAIHHDVIPFFIVGGLIVDIYIPAVNIAILTHSEKDMNLTTELPSAHSILRHQALVHYYNIGVIHLKQNAEVNNFIKNLKSKIEIARKSQYIHSEKHHEVELALNHDQGEKSQRIRKFIKHIDHSNLRTSVTKEQVFNDTHEEESCIPVPVPSTTPIDTPKHLADISEKGSTIYHIMKPSSQLKKRIEKITDDDWITHGFRRCPMATACTEVPLHLALYSSSNFFRFLENNIKITFLVTEMSNKQYWETSSHQSLLGAAKSILSQHLRSLLKDDSRNKQLILDVEGCVCDFSRQKVNSDVMKLLFQLAKERHLEQKIAAMFAGQHINLTEDRSVLHVALRSHSTDQFIADGKNVVDDVHHVLNRIHQFVDRVRSGAWKGHTGKELKDIICIGIGGSYLGPEFVFEALRTYEPCAKACENRRLRFLANVDPIDVIRSTEGLTPETTLVIVVSKTFTTAETMLNARTLRQWLLSKLRDESAIGKHMVAVSTNIKEATNFGILSDNVFGFWDWVGGRFSVCSAVGCLPLALHFGYDHVRKFLDGCRAMDLHFQSTPLEHNLPVVMGLIGVWNSTYLGFSDVAVLPYCQALLRFAAHIQQLTMESNGKRVTIDGTPLPLQAGEIFFGEPGTNGQHSFYQLLHQGRTVPADFIGFCHSQNNVFLPGEAVSNHDELMSNFFAQPNALALGKTAEQCKEEGVPPHLIEHKVFTGDRPSTSLLLPICDPYNVGILLSLYEHRTAVQGFIWGVNSFDQWGVELGKVLAKNIRNILSESRSGKSSTLKSELPSSSCILMERYLRTQA